jgi:TPR repeat protein
MPHKLIASISLPPATILSVPIYDYAEHEANEELENMGTEVYFSCCGKSTCRGCVYTFCRSGNTGKCPFCNSDRSGKTDDERAEELKKRVEANDAGAIYALGNYYYNGKLGLLRDREKAIELYARAAELGSSEAHFALATNYDAEGNSKKEKFHNEAAAMAGHEIARCNLGTTEAQSGNMERAVKHWIIAASAGCYNAMNNMLVAFYEGLVSRDEIDSTLTAYNNSYAEMRSEARDAFIQFTIDHP